MDCGLRIADSTIADLESRDSMPGLDSVDGFSGTLKLTSQQSAIRNPRSAIYSYLNPSTGSSREALQEGYNVERKLIATVIAATASTSVACA